MKKGFVLMETIVVISVLCVTLVMLYGGFYNVIRISKMKDRFDNTEYLYKTYLINDYLEGIIDESTILGSKIYIYCSNKTTKCKDIDIDSDVYLSNLIKSLRIEAIYITMWDTTYFDTHDYGTFEPTTQNYIKLLNPERRDGYRIIVMFRDENHNPDDDVSMKNLYQYGSIEFKSKVYSISI